jgi:hypothetical protein
MTGDLHQRRQKTRERLAGAGRRDQQRRTILARLLQQRQLMLTWRPTPRCKPAQKDFGQWRASKKIWLA